MDLGIDDDELATCVSCGLCLPHCPTYRVTGEETLSPRGRIAAMRQVQWEGVGADESFVRSVETCVQCRGCEPVCPSGVPFGHLVEPARATLAEGATAPPAPDDSFPRAGPGGDGAPAAGRPRHRPPLPFRLALRSLRRHRLVLAGSSLLGVGQRLHLIPPGVSRRLGLPARVPVLRRRLHPSGRDVWLFTGCVMDAWMRDVHADVQRVVEATGAGVALPLRGGACCGALAHHAGLAAEARALALRTMGAFPGEAPILVDAAGCGAMLKDYGRLLGTPEAAAFSARVLDVHEWLAEHIDSLTRAAGTTAPVHRPSVAVQDPCHLRHVQRAHASVRTVLSPFASLVELDDEGLCCGAGGAYAAVQPELAGAIRDRKVAAIARSGAPLVASANPGCALHLAAAGVDVVHPCQIVARGLEGADGALRPPRAAGPSTRRRQSPARRRDGARTGPNAPGRPTRAPTRRGR
jgi:glycolate oxidase iron-sulfur subunit